MKKNTTIIAIIAVVVIAGVIALFSAHKTTAPAASTDNTKTAQTIASPNTVHMKSLDFETKTLNVKKGTTVTWQNDDSAKHTITFDDASLASANSDLIATGGTYTHMFDTVGSFAYYCTPHPFMKATIVVTE